jgi:molybdopterin-guanine dinucleotide biosynthesis protein A
LILGLFVGGRATRMGGLAKGLLQAPADPAVDRRQTILDRTLALAQRVGVEVALVGRTDAYPKTLVTLPDPEGDLGPLGGLSSLCAHAGEGHVIALACDMPYVTEALLGRLVHHASRAPVVAPKRDGRWEPLFARYAAAPTLAVVGARIARRELSLQGLLDELGAEELPLMPGEPMLLEDWDRPEDIP